MLKYLAYVSRQSFILTNEDLSNLLVTFRINNTRNEITGMLIYFDGTFVQFLEGPENTTNLLFDKIKNDKRHQEMILLVDGITTQREFGDWSMAFKKLTADDTSRIVGQKDFKKEDLFKGKHPNSEHPGLVLIKSFVNNLHI